VLDLYIFFADKEGKHVDFDHMANKLTDNSNERS
jgi:hypothetical protein